MRRDAADVKVEVGWGVGGGGGASVSVQSREVGGARRAPRRGSCRRAATLRLILIRVGV